MYTKITMGMVIQNFDDTGKPISQEFVAGDEVVYENKSGEPISAPDNEIYLPFHMKQPEEMAE